MGGTISFLCCQSRRRSSAAQSMLWGACGAVYAFEPSFGPVGRQPHAGDTHTRRALREGGTTVDALLQSVWDRGTLLAPATIRRPTLSSPATFARTFFELGLWARAFFLPSSSVFELASWSDRPCRLVSDRAFPVCVFLPTTPLSPLSPPCRGGSRVVVGRRRQIPGAGRRTDSTRGCRSWGECPRFFPRRPTRRSTQPRPLGQSPEAGVLAAAGRDCRWPPAVGVLAASGRDCRLPLAASVLAAAGRDCRQPPAAATDHLGLPTAYKRGGGGSPRDRKK